MSRKEMWYDSLSGVTMMLLPKAAADSPTALQGSTSGRNLTSPYIKLDHMSRKSLRTGPVLSLAYVIDRDWRRSTKG